MKKTKSKPVKTKVVADVSKGTTKDSAAKPLKTEKPTKAKPATKSTAVVTKTVEGVSVKQPARISWLQFFIEVRQEAGKVTWPTRKETLVTTAMVFIMVAIFSVFLFSVDSLISFVVSEVLKLSFGA